jgi:hypothetical protein
MGEFIEADGDIDSMRFVTRAREILAAAYPAIDRAGLLRELHRSGRTAFPSPLMLRRASSPSRASLLRRVAAVVRRTRVGAETPGFSADFYRAAHPDIAQAGISPWLHYQVRGRIEGRSPHPLIDLEWLSDAIPDTRRADLVDVYLTERRYWAVAPGPYVDVERFMVAGPWDGVTHPFLQILRESHGEPWVRNRLRLTDLAANHRDAYLAGVGVLTGYRPAGGVSAFRAWTIDLHARRPTAADVRWTVIPGFMMGADGVAHWVSERVVSPGQDAIRVADLVITRDTERRQRVGQLVYLTGSLGRDELLAAGADAVVAPATAEQERALRLFLPSAQVLAYGEQVRVVAERVRVVEGTQLTSEEGRPAGGDVLVVSADERVRPDVVGLVQAGVALVTIDRQGAAPWVPVLSSGRRIFGAADALHKVRPYVDPSLLRRYPVGGSR